MLIQKFTEWYIYLASYLRFISRFDLGTEQRHWTMSLSALERDSSDQGVPLHTINISNDHGQWIAGNVNEIGHAKFHPLWSRWEPDECVTPDEMSTRLKLELFS